MQIPLMKPYITQEIKDAVCDVLDTGYLTEGPVTAALEESFKDYTGARHAIAVTNCTNGLEMALRVLGVGPGDEVIVPDYTYPATAAVVNIVGATIVIVDISSRNMLIDYDAIEDAVTERTKAVIPVSLFGNPLDWDRLDRLKKKHGLFIIEDAACSIGADYRNKKVGALADISVFSLHPRKFITTGEGGIITTDHPQWADWMVSYKHFGMKTQESRVDTSFERIGTNYKLSNVAAAIGLVQMRHIDELLARRRAIADYYYRHLDGTAAITIPETTAGGGHSYQSCCVRVDDRDRIMRQMMEEGIQTQIGTYALHMHTAFSENPDCRCHGSMRESRLAFDQCLTLPSYHDLQPSEQDVVIQHLKRMC